MVFSSDVPMEAPSCCPTLTVAEATPASCGATPKVPVLIDGAMTRPMPIAAMMHGPSTPAAYPVCGPSCASQAIAPAAISMPDATPRRTDCHGHQAASLRRPSDKLAALRDGQRRHERLSPVERRHATPVDDRLGRSRAEGAA